jgi:23S rRNA (uracil1939-C5)-methyltransferase
MEYKKNQILNIIVEVQGINGEGVVKTTEPTLFVPYLLSGEEASVKIIKTHKKFLIGKLIEITKISKYRTEPKCPVFTKCGGCQLQHQQYEDQLEFKTNLVTETLKKVGRIETEVDFCVKSENEYEYRNKISLPVRDVEGNVKLGFFAGGSHRIVEIQSCPLQQNLTSKVIKIFKEFMISNNISAYNEYKQVGLVKHLVAREFGNKLLVAVVINGQAMPEAIKLYEKMSEEFGEVGLYLNHNTKKNNVILGSENTFVAGLEFLEEELMGIKLKTEVLSFMQVNNDIRDKIYSSVVDKIKSIKVDNIVDAYSGAGLLTGLLAKNVDNRVYGLEIIKEAVDASNKMLSENKLEKNVTNILGNCTKTLPELIKKLEGETSIILDPPRKGVSREVIRAVLKTKPKQIIYLACGLTNLARDLSYMLNIKSLKTGEFNLKPKPIYKIKSVTPHDMFPQTKHVETLVELELI